MRVAWTIARREFAAYFVSPIAYVVAAMLLFVLGLIFYYDLSLQFERATTAYFFGNLTSLSFLIAPALTMRLLAEERRTRTLELLLTAPVREAEVVVGKFLAGLGFYIFLVLLASVYPLILFLFGNPDPGALWTGYLGIALFGAAIIALGTLASAVTQNQIVAYVLGSGFLLGLWLVDMPADLVGTGLGQVLRALSITGNLEGFAQGIVDTRHIVYYLTLTVLALFIATRVLEGRRWNG